MPRDRETVDHATLQRMHAAGVITDATLVAEPAGWAVVVQVRRTQYPLAAKRGGIRLWAKMKSAARYLREEMGLAEFRVDARHYDVEQIQATRRRPDAAAKLKRAHAAAEHEAWFRGQVEAAVAAADDPDAQWLEHEDVMSEARQRLEARLEHTGDT